MGEEGKNAIRKPEHAHLFAQLHKFAPESFKQEMAAKAREMDLLPKATHVGEDGQVVFTSQQVPKARHQRPRRWSAVPMLILMISTTARFSQFSEAAMQDNLALRALFSTATNPNQLQHRADGARNACAQSRHRRPLNLTPCCGCATASKVGHAALIAQALEAFKKIKTPAKELEDRYCEHLRIASGGNPFAVIFGGMGFAGNLESLASSSARSLPAQRCRGPLWQHRQRVQRHACRGCLQEALRGLKQTGNRIWLA